MNSDLFEYSTHKSGLGFGIKVHVYYQYQKEKKSKTFHGIDIVSRPELRDQQHLDMVGVLLWNNIFEMADGGLEPQTWPTTELPCPTLLCKICPLSLYLWQLTYSCEKILRRALLYIVFSLAWLHTRCFVVSVFTWYKCHWLVSISAAWTPAAYITLNTAQEFYNNFQK